jgi:hypothetical protein
MDFPVFKGSWDMDPVTSQMNAVHSVSFYMNTNSWQICEYQYIFPPTDALLFATVPPCDCCSTHSATAKEYNTGGYRSNLPSKFDYGCLATRRVLTALDLPDEGVWNYVRWNTVGAKTGLYDLKLSQRQLWIFPSCETQPCKPLVIRRFGGTYHLHLYGRKSEERETIVHEVA